MSKASLKKRSPREANTLNKVCELKRDNVNLSPRFWMLVDGTTVTLCEQAVGEPSTASVTIPRAIFAKACDWFNAPQPVDKNWRKGNT